MKEIKTAIVINASPRIIWRIITDLKRFQEWNPFITKASGEVKEGKQLNVHIQPPDSSGMNFKPTVIRVQNERELRWLGRILIPGIFDGEHIFEMEPINEEKTRFIQREKFKGILVPFLWNSLDKNARRGFENMNAALKQRAEKQANSTAKAV